MMKTKDFRHEVMSLAWQFVHKNGFGRSHALRAAWENLKLRDEMGSCIVKFYFRKSNGTVREAWGTLNPKFMPPVTSTRKRAANDTVQCYWDTECSQFRSYKKANLLRRA